MRDSYNHQALRATLSNSARCGLEYSHQIDYDTGNAKLCSGLISRESILCTSVEIQLVPIKSTKFGTHPQEVEEVV